MEIKKVVIEVIPHKEQRYPTAGDWQFLGKDLIIRVSDMNNWKSEMAVARHEFDEACLCLSRGIKGEDVDNFDFLFEKELADGKHDPDDEPGDDPRAPYHKEHAIATVGEMSFCIDLGIEWKEHEANIFSLF